MNTYIKQLADKYLGYLLIILFLPITRLLGIVLKRNHLLKSAPSTILFIKILGLGSLLVSSESIRVIKKKYPRTKLILLTDYNIAKGIKPFNLFDELWTVESNNILAVLSGSVRFLFQSWKLKKLWVVDLEVYSKLTTVYSLMTFALNRFGFYLSPVFFRKYLNTHNVFFDQSAFLEDSYLHMAEIVTGEAINHTNSVKPIRKEEQLKPFIALNNTCSDLAYVRKLPDQTFATICQWLLENTSYNLVLLGAPKDKEMTDQFLQKNTLLISQKNRIVNFAGTNDFEVYYRFLSEQCVCLITIDSGPLHIARALGLPTLSIWGPTNPQNYLKILPEEQNKHLYYYSKVHCSPCIHHFEKLPCGGDNFCMKIIETNLIIEKIKNLLSYAGSSHLA